MNESINSIFLIILTLEKNYNLKYIYENNLENNILLRIA